MILLTRAVDRGRTAAMLYTSVLLPVLLHLLFGPNQATELLASTLFFPTAMARIAGLWLDHHIRVESRAPRTTSTT